MSKTILEEASDITANARQNDYGHPRFDFTCVAEFLTTYLRRANKLKDDCKIDAEDWPMFMILAKVAREIHRHKRDNLVDIAGYAQTREMLEGCEEIERRDKCDYSRCSNDATVFTVVGHPTNPLRRKVCWAHRADSDPRNNHEDPSHVAPSPSKPEVDP